MGESQDGLEALHLSVGIIKAQSSQWLVVGPTANVLGSESENLCTHQVDTVFPSTVVIVVWLPRVPVGVGDLFKSVLPHIGALISLVSKAYPVGLAGG